MDLLDPETVEDRPQDREHVGVVVDNQCADAAEVYGHGGGLVVAVKRPASR